MIPYMALLLRDLSLIELHNKTKLKDNMINLEKMRMVANILLPLRKLQDTPYLFPRNEQIVRYFLDYRTLSEDEMWDCSLAIENHRKQSIV